MRNKASGFSLIELMVSVAIIGMLASIAIPSYNRLLSRSRGKAHLGTLGSLVTVLKGIGAAYGKFPVTVGNTSTGLISANATSAFYEDCDALPLASVSDKPALSEFCRMMPPLPSFADPQVSHCSTGDVAYMYLGNGFEWKVYAHCVAARGTQEMYYWSGKMDPMRDGGASPTAVDPPGIASAWSMAIYSSSAVAGW